MDLLHLELKFIETMEAQLEVTLLQALGFIIYLHPLNSHPSNNLISTLVNIHMKQYFQNLPEATRKRVVEYLQPPNMDQAALQAQYGRMAEYRNIINEGWTDDDPIARQQIERMHERAKTTYQKSLERLTKVPGIHETYNYFWDDSKPFPDQRQPPPPGGGIGPITS